MNFYANPDELIADNIACLNPGFCVKSLKSYITDVSMTICAKVFVIIMARKN
jgi:hypothetical protein